MEWVYPRRRGVEWKQGWAGETVASISTPPIQLLAIFGIVFLLLCLSNYTNYKAHLDHSALNFHFSLVLLPILLIILLAAYSSNWMQRLYSSLRQPRVRSAGGSGSFPWGTAIFVVLLLVLLSYQSSFHSKWFGPLWTSD